MFIEKRKVILAKLEAVPGTDALPTIVDIIDCRSSKMEQESTLEKKNTYSASLSDQGGAVTEIKGRHTFEVDMKASGAVDTRSQLGKLLIACGFKETAITGGLKYMPGSNQDEMQTITLYEYFLGDGGVAILKKIVGARGTFTATMEAGKVAKVQFTFEGRYVEPIDATNPTPVSSNYEQSIPAIVESSQFTYDGGELVCRGVTLNSNNDLYSLPDVNSPEGILKTILTGRSISGTMAPDMVNMAVKNFFAMWTGNQKAAIHMQVGHTAGNIIEIDMPAVQLENVNDAEDSGYAYQEIPFICTGTDDELQFVFK